MKDIQRPPGMPILGPMLEESLYDPHDAPEHSRWLPFNREAGEFASCVEACKQILELRPLLTIMPTPRTYAMLATPVFSLAEHTILLHRLLGKEDRSRWPKNDNVNFTDVARLLRKHIKGPLKKLRDKLSAHHDSSALTPDADMPPATSEILLPPLAQSLVILMLALNFRTSFSYYRLPDPQKPMELQVMVEYPLATTFLFDSSGRPIEALEFRLATDPRHELATVLKATIALHNEVAPNATPVQPPIDFVEREPDETIFADRTFTSRIL